MKHTIVRSLAMLIGAGLLAYVGWLFFQGYHVVAAEQDMVNSAALVVCAGIALFMLSIVFMPSLMPTNRWSLLVLGVVIVMGSHMYLQDTASRMIYLQDIMKLVGVFLVIVGPLKLLLSPEQERQLEAEGLEIIEV